MSYSLEYIAGFFDGEGSIGVYKNNYDNYFLRTQLVQNESKQTIDFFNFLISKYGGSMNSPTKTSSGNYKHNWQISNDRVVVFLKDIVPFLTFKKDQAKIAIWWQQQRTPMSRDSRGRVVNRPVSERVLDKEVSILLKKLKKIKKSDIIEYHNSLPILLKDVTSKVIASVKPLINIKG